MSSRRNTIEPLLYFLAFFLAITIRFLHLGAQPLSDFEARWALQSLGVAQGLRPALDPNPAYILLTAVNFFIFDATNFLARFWPALAGSLLALAPLFLRGRLGRIPSLVLSFGLAIDPGLVALSRLAGGPMLAISFAIFTWFTWEQDRPRLAGMLAALALLSGTALWPGLLGLGIALGIMAALKRALPVPEASEETETTASPIRPARERFRSALGWGLATLLLGGSLFFLSPNGLSALAASLPAYLAGWGSGEGVPARHLLTALPAYAPLALLFGLVGLVRGWWKMDRRAIFLGLWVLAAFLLALFYPARQVGDLAWMLLPLWTLAALEIGRHLDVAGLTVWELAGVTLLVVTILAFAWIDLAGVPSFMGDAPFLQTRMLLFFGALLLAVLSLLLVGMGWSEKLAVIGAVWGFGLFLLAYTLGAGIGAAGLRPEGSQEMWSPGAQIGQAELLVRTANDISDWQKGYGESLSITIQGVDSPALRWALRGWDVQDEMPLDGSSPAMVVTPQGVTLQEAASYRGQDFTWRQTPFWDMAVADSWLRWVVVRQMPVQSENIVLWVRNDLFMDGESDAELP